MKRTLALGVLVVLVVLLAGGGFFYLRLRGQAAIGAGYAAKQLCSCVFVGGRSLESCGSDLPERMDVVRVELLPDGVRGYVTALASRVARFEPGFGCTLH